MRNSLNEKSILTETTHIYVDDSTGDEYIFDGIRLVKIKNGIKPGIGYHGDEEGEAEEDRKREERAAAERAESGEEDESEEDKNQRLDKIRQFLDDDSIGNQIEHESEVKVTDEKKRKQAAAAAELKKNLSGATKNSAVISELSKDLQKFLAKEVGSSVRNTTWKKYNGNYDNSGIMKPGHRYEKIGKIPVIQIYIDQSGSWGENDIKIGKDILKSIMEFEIKKQIKSEVYYFANHIHTDASTARKEGGTGAGSELIQQLNATKPDNVIIITDDDFDRWGINGSYTAPGGVWLVFRGSRSSKLISAVRGKKLTKYYDIDKIL